MEQRRSHSRLLNHVTDHLGGSAPKWSVSGHVARGGQDCDCDTVLQVNSEPGTGSGLSRSLCRSR